MIGVFDSGIGGLGVLGALRAELPQQRFTYISDGDNAPYGERGDAFVTGRSLAITRELVERHRADLVVVACNTATAAAIATLRDAYPHIPFVGIEPALKPAIRMTQTGRIGVMATRGTLESAKFAALLRSLDGQAEFVLQPCDGLAHAIEVGDEPRVRTLCAHHAGAIMAREGVDTLVLGCTHYAFAEDVIRRIVGPGVAIVEPGPWVAKRAAALLA